MVHLITISENASDFSENLIKHLNWSLPKVSVLHFEVV